MSVTVRQIYKYSCVEKTAILKNLDRNSAGLSIIIQVPTHFMKYTFGELEKHLHYKLSQFSHSMATIN